MSGVGALYERTSFRFEECAVIDRTYTVARGYFRFMPQGGTILDAIILPTERL